MTTKKRKNRGGRVGKKQNVGEERERKLILKKKKE